MGSSPSHHSPRPDSQNNSDVLPPHTGHSQPPGSLSEVVALPPPQAPSPEPMRGIYSRYKWNMDQVSAAIRIGTLSPLGGAESERRPGVPVFCEICYQYYPSINTTSCCRRQICTECVAASFSPPPQPASCPFCRRADVRLSANVVCGGSERDDEEFIRYNEKVRAGLADKHIDEFETELPPEVNAEVEGLAKAFKVPSRDLRELYAAGLTRDEIILQLRAGLVH